MPSLIDRLVRLLLTSGHRLLKLNWRTTRPRTFGAHALALTPGREVILVRLRYAPGWRLPGGGRSAQEAPRDAMLRELREEIGMISHGAVRLAVELDEHADWKHDLASLFIVEDVVYRPPRWSWEVEMIIERPLGDLPHDMSPIAKRWIEQLARAL